MLNIENNPQKDVTRTNLQCDISDFALTKVNYVNFFKSKTRSNVRKIEAEQDVIYLHTNTLQNSTSP